MTEQKGTWRETQAAARVAEQEARWGLDYVPEDRPGPEELAQAAYERGDRLFQIDLPVQWVQGATTYNGAVSRTYRPNYYDVLGAIDARGWRLEFVSAAFLVSGSTTTAMPGSVSSGMREAAHGVLTALYVFRRAA